MSENIVIALIAFAGTLIGNGSEFYELDTKKTFIYSIGNADQTSSHWWEK